MHALSIGHSYTVAVAAKDTAGNWSSYNYSPTVNVRVTDDQAFISMRHGVAHH